MGVIYKKGPLSEREMKRLKKKLKWDMVITNVPVYPGLHMDDPRQEFEDRYYRGDKLVLVVRHGQRVLKAVKYQTGERASLRLDRKRRALPPGKRISRTGRIYWETRRNRSDLRRGI
jgi:hypothetical protein